MKFMPSYRYHANWLGAIYATILMQCCPSVIAEEQPLISLNESAQNAFNEGKYKKAQILWLRAIQILENNGQKDILLESCLKHLGQSYRRLERNFDAFQALSRAKDMSSSLGLKDLELADEMAALALTYKSIDPAELGEGTALALKKANVSNISLQKQGTKSKMQVDLPARFEKPLEDNTVDALAFDKQVTLDFEQLPDGTVLMTDIKGLRIHAKEIRMWVNLIQAIIRPEDSQGSFPADVTAGKMGVTKTVSAMLPHKGFEPLAGLLKQLNSMSVDGIHSQVATDQILPEPNSVCEITGWF